MKPKFRNIENREIKEFYHATTKECFDSLQKNGFGYGDKTVWICSERDKMYFYKSSSNEDENMHMQKEAIINALIAAAVFDSREQDVVLLTLRVSEDDIYIGIDDSAYGMEDYSVSIDADSLNKLISDGKASVTYSVIEKVYDPNLRFLYFSFLNEESLKLIETGRFSKGEMHTFSTVENAIDLNANINEFIANDSFYENISCNLENRNENNLFIESISGRKQENTDIDRIY